VIGVRSLRTMSTRRLLAVIAAALVLAAGGTAIALAATTNNGPVPPAKPLAQAIHDAATAPPVDGISARIKFTNHLIDSSSLQGSDPILSGATGRLWIGANHRLRLELQSDSGDAQIVSDGKTVTIYDATMNSVYRADLPRDLTAGDRTDAPPTLASIQADLARLAEHWNVSGAEPTSHAGRPAYQVRIAPKHDGGLLGAAELAADANTGVPLRAAVYATGNSTPVLELSVTRISYGKVGASVFDVTPPAGAKVTDFTPEAPAAVRRGAEAKPVTGEAAVAKAVPFTLVAPDKLVGLPRHEVRLIRAGDHPAALVTYGAGLGGIAVVEQAADAGGAPVKPREGESGLSLPTVSINGATGQELDTALGTMVRFTRGGVTYTVIGSVPPAAAEAAARGL
jgi:outer membrane lipoprotein-sorting protein